MEEIWNISVAHSCLVCQDISSRADLQSERLRPPSTRSIIFLLLLFFICCHCDNKPADRLMGLLQRIGPPVASADPAHQEGGGGTRTHTHARTHTCTHAPKHSHFQKKLVSSCLSASCVHKDVIDQEIAARQAVWDMLHPSLGSGSPLSTPITRARAHTRAGLLAPFAWQSLVGALISILRVDNLSGQLKQSIRS